MGLISLSAYRCGKNLLIQIFLILALFTLANAQNPQRGLLVDPRSSAWGKYHALIVGINDYSEWPRLQTAVKDATVIRDLLVSRYGFGRKNVILRTDKEASRYQVNRDLRYLATSMGPNDNLLIYYAGHGQLDDITGDGYWVPAEGKLKDPTTWISNAYIKALLSSEKVHAKNVVVIADSCYSGSMLRGGPSLMSLDDQRYQEKLAKKAALRSRQVISSGGIEPVADGGAEGHSLFAFYFIDALRKNERAVVDLENLFHTKVWKPVTEIGDQRPNVGRLKTPMDQDGQFVLYNVAVDQAKPHNQKQNNRLPEKTTTASPQNMNAEEELWAIVKTSSIIDDYKYFLNEYPKGRFSSAAKLKIQQLKRKQNAQKMVAAVTTDISKQNPVIKPATPKEKQSAQNMVASLVPAPGSRNTSKQVVTLPERKEGLAKTDGNFVKYSNGIVYDKKSGLEWFAGPDTDMSWYDAKDWIKKLYVDGGKWRFPKKSELKSLHKKKKGPLTITPLLTDSVWHVWSNSTPDSGPIWAYSFNFKGHGTWNQDTYVSTSSNMRVIAVRSYKKTPKKASADTKPKASKIFSNKDDSTSIALFPIKLSNTAWEQNLAAKEREGLEGIARVAMQDNRMILKYCYVNIDHLIEGATPFDAVISEENSDLWIKKSILSQLEPNFEAVKKIGSKIDADVAILILIKVEGLSNTGDIYLLDYKTGKVFSKMQIKIGRYTISEDVTRITATLLKKYRKSK